MEFGRWSNARNERDGLGGGRVGRRRGREVKSMPESGGGERSDGCDGVDDDGWTWY